MNIMGTCWHLFTSTDTAITKGSPSCSPSQPPPPCSELLSSLLAIKEVRGRPEKFKHDFVTPVGVMIVHCICCSHRAGCTWHTTGTPFRLGGEATVTSMVCQKEEKVWVCLKELQG
ncbi:hypothetical protein AMECASPLE_037329 [Ameca splendens]|uniref:Uncharacterized protein n=1 Tax=Ameca splendens TaxID=208324 RepID=A0ABV1AEA8_9TELE